MKLHFIDKCPWWWVGFSWIKLRYSTLLQQAGSHTLVGIIISTNFEKTAEPQTWNCPKSSNSKVLNIACQEMYSTTCFHSKLQSELSNVKVIFLLGQLRNSTFQANVTNESETYGDILQEGFIDTYANLTVKSLMLLKWFSRECHQVPYVLKTDDDMYINLKQLFQLVRKRSIIMPSLFFSESSLDYVSCFKSKDNVVIIAEAKYFIPPNTSVHLFFDEKSWKM